MQTSRWRARQIPRTGHDPSWIVLEQSTYDPRLRTSVLLGSEPCGAHTAGGSGDALASSGSGRHEDVAYTSRTFKPERYSAVANAEISLRPSGIGRVPQL